MRPPIHGDLEDLAFDLTGPYFGRTLAITPTKIVFDGYFRYESELLREDRPIHRFLEFQGHTYVLAFVRKRIGKNTSSYWYDEEEGGDICLTPTEIIELKYRVVEKDPPRERWAEIVRMIREERKILREMNEELYGERIRREWAAKRAKQAACVETAVGTS